MQHRFSLPSLEVDDFPQVGFTAQLTPICESASGTDILQEILSVAQASHELINQTNYSETWGVNYAPDDDFSFMIGRDNYNQVNGMSSERYMDKPWEDPNTMSIQIGDLDEDFKAERMVENLRWVGMSDKDLEKVKLFYVINMLDCSLLLLLLLFFLILFYKFFSKVNDKHVTTNIA